MEQNNFMIQKLMEHILSKSTATSEETTKVMSALNEEITNKPFRVAVIGQSGVGKSTTLNAVFGLKEYTSDIAEGTTDIVEKVFPMRNGFNLSIFDMPGLGCDYKKDKEYETMYAKVLPDCDVIVYIISASSKDFGEDCRILKEVVLPICNEKSIRDNLIIAINKIDTIGEMSDPDNPLYEWDVINNEPTVALKRLIKGKLMDITNKLIDEGLVGSSDSLSHEQVVFYSAIFNYNLGSFLSAITKAGKRGWIWTATVGFEQIGKWSDKKLG